MCRILEAIIRNYKQQSEQDHYNRSVVDIHMGRKADFEKDARESSPIENSSMFYQPTDEVVIESESNFSGADVLTVKLCCQIRLLVIIRQ